MSGGGEFQRHWRYVAGRSARADDVNRLFDRFVLLLCLVTSALAGSLFVWIGGLQLLGILDLVLVLFLLSALRCMIRQEERASA